MKTVKKFAALALSAVLCMLSFAGCSGSGQSTQASGSAAKSAGELNLFIWTEYIPQSVIDGFTKETGIKVNVSTYSTNEDMLAKVKASNKGIYDIVVPSDYMVKMMIDQNLLQRLDKSKLTNLKNINDIYMDQYFDKGNSYSVPYLGGAAALCIDKTQVKDKITSFKQILDSKYADSIVALNDFRAVIGMTAKSLGYSMNTTNDKQLANVKKQLMKLKPNIKVLDSDSPKTSMLNGETDIGFMWNGEIALCMQESNDFDIVFPNEGCYIFLDNMCVLKGAKNNGNAIKFINYILEARTEKAILEKFPYLSPNKAAIAIMPSSYKNNKASNVPVDIIKKGEYVKDIGAAVSKYDDMWTDFTK